MHTVITAGEWIYGDRRLLRKIWAGRAGLDLESLVAQEADRAYGAGKLIEETELRDLIAALLK